MKRSIAQLRTVRRRVGWTFWISLCLWLVASIPFMLLWRFDPDPGRTYLPPPAWVTKGLVSAGMVVSSIALLVALITLFAYLVLAIAVWNRKRHEPAHSPSRAEVQN
jgi:hypothetical protein